MHKKEFRENIYRYCDNHVKEKVLSTVFNNLWIQSVQEISPQDLEILTNGIINDLGKDNLKRKKVLEEIPKPYDLDVPYGMYEILPHERLIDK